MDARPGSHGPLSIDSSVAQAPERPAEFFCHFVCCLGAAIVGPEFAHDHAARLDQLADQQAVMESGFDPDAARREICAPRLTSTMLHEPTGIRTLDGPLAALDQAEQGTPHPKPRGGGGHQPSRRQGSAECAGIPKPHRTCRRVAPESWFRDGLHRAPPKEDAILATDLRCLNVLTIAMGHE